MEDIWSPLHHRLCYQAYQGGVDVALPHPRAAIPVSQSDVDDPPFSTFLPCVVFVPTRLFDDTRLRSYTGGGNFLASFVFRRHEANGGYRSKADCRTRMDHMIG